MAQLGRRSTGFSRRAQFGLFIGYVLSLAAVVVGLALLLMSRAAPERFAILRTTVTDIASPVLTVLRAPIVGTKKTISGVGEYFNAIDRNRVLGAQMEMARPKLVKARLLERENQRLRDLLDLREPSRERVAAARIVSAAPGSVMRTALVAAGSVDGVEPGQIVREPTGLVGRVIEAGSRSARVLMIQDSGSRVPGILVRDGTPALIIGTNGPLLEIRTVLSDRNPFRPGDLLVTSGAGGVFPPDLPVAVVERRTAEGALARPAVRPEHLDFVLIERPWSPPSPSVVPVPSSPPLADPGKSVAP